MSGSEILVDKDVGTVILNETEIANDAVMDALVRQHPEMAAMVRWGAQTQAVGRDGGIFQRDRYLTPDSIFDQFKVALDAIETDDVVSGVMETTEALAFHNIRIECDDEDEQDVWNQILEDIDFYTSAREMWRELFSVSQYYAATYWVRKDYKVRGKTKGGNRKKKEFKNLLVPGGITLLDPLKVVPVGNFMFGKERLAYIADRDQVAKFDEVLAGNNTTDLVVEQLLIGKYQADKAEKQYLKSVTGGKDVDNLYILNPNNVWRHTATRPSYQRFATVRMKSIFEILDLKQQLRQMDRAHLIGGPLRVDQRIATPQGWKPIGAARVGDEVFSVDGKPTTIIGVFPQGVLSMYKVTFTDGAVVYCDESHPWTVFDRSGRERTIPLRQILDEGLFETNGPGKRVHKYRIPVASPLELPESDLTLDPYLVGCLLGDGSLSQSMPKITCAEPESDQPWRDVLPAGMTVSRYEKREGFCYQYGLKGSEWRINEVTEGLREIGLWGTTCEDKYIPELYLWGSVDQRWALLQGLCDSDGSPSGNGGVEFSTVSPKLADGVVQLVQSLGGVAKVYEREANGNERLSYRVHISLNQKDAPFRIARKVARWSPRKYPIVRAIHSVEKSVDAEAVCIKTAREDGLFLTEGMVVTHNTNFIVLVKKGSDSMPAKPQEIQSLATQVKMASRVPVIVGDHRLEVEIITPKLDYVLVGEKYNSLDARITARLFQMFMTGNYSAGAKGDDSIKLARVVARGMETRRNMIGFNTLRNLILPTFRKNKDVFTERPEIQFQPKRIALDFDPNVLNFFQELRDRGDLSRETILGEMDIDQEKEARRRKTEEEIYDDVFKPPMAMLAPGAPGGPPAPPEPQGQPGQPGQTPARGPGATTNRTGKTNGGGKGAGRAGGRKGGANRDSFNSGPPRGPAKSQLEGLSNEELNDLIDLAIDTLQARDE